MSILQRNRWVDPEPEWQNEFATHEAWAAFVGEKYFNGLVPGSPFLLVIRTLRHDSSGRRHPNTWMETAYFVGYLADEQRLFGHVEALDNFDYTADSFIATREFLCFPEVWRDKALVNHGYGVIAINHRPNFNYTPVVTPFVPPFVMGRPHDLFEKEVDAFTVACGVSAMEELAAEEARWDKTFLPWYVRSVGRLGIPVESDLTRTTTQAEKIGIIRRLRKYHADRGANKDGEQLIKRNLTAALHLGMDKDYELMDIDGFRCQPAVVIEDFQKLYAID